ncbi:MAG: acetyltransferase [Thermoguttaceae bacterium]|nr:acetyltransferase [Thermoguttaceae bacterium]
MTTAKRKIVIIGASGHGKVVADLAKKNGYDDVVFLDDNPNAGANGGFRVVGTTRDVSRFAECDFIVAIGAARVRERLQTRLLDANLRVVSLIHPNAVVADDCVVGPGTAVMAGVVINPSVRIGAGCIVNTAASVDHDCVVEDFAHISVGARLAGTVSAGARSWIGIGATISNNIKICADCTIGAGAVVVKDIDEPGVYVGVPARKMVKR